MKQTRPLLEFACCWIIGSSLAILLPGSRFLLVLVALILIGPLLVQLIGRSWKQILLALFAITAAALYWQYNDARNVTRLPESLGLSPGQTAGAFVQVVGIMESPPELDGDRADFTMEIRQIAKGAGNVQLQNTRNEKVRVQVRLSTKQEIEQVHRWMRGQVAELAGTLEQPMEARNFGGFDYAHYLHGKRMHWILNVQGAESVHTKRGPFSAAYLLSYNDRMRTAVGERIAAIFGGQNAGYMKGLLIGDMDELDPDVYKGFSTLGLTHILAISGSHVAVNLAVLLWLLRRLRLARETAITAGLVFIPFYVLITGLSPSVVRAGIMAMIGLYLLRKQRLKDGLNILAAAALLMLLWEPYYLLDVSFELSFAVTAGLIVFVPLLQPWFHFLSKRVADAAAITLAAQLISFPLTIYYFNQFSLLSLGANFFIVPLVSLVSLPMGTAALLASFIWLPLGSAIAYPVKLINNWTFDAVAWLEGRSGFMTIWKSPHLWWIIAYYILLFLLLRFGVQRRAAAAVSVSSPDETAPLTPQMSPFFPAASKPHFRWRRAGFTLIIILAMGGMLYSGYLPAYGKGTGIVQFIDVGQGDSILITTPGGRNILVDSGGTVSFRKASDVWRDKKQPFEVGAEVVVPLLKQRGIHSLDAVIITHWDQDHSGGLPAILENIPVQALIVNGSQTDTEIFKKINRIALQKEIPVYFAKEGMSLKPDSSTKLEFLAPLLEDSGARDSKIETSGLLSAEIPFVEEQNAYSVVFLLEMDGKTFLFTGDMDEAVEKSWLAQIQSGLPAGISVTPPVDVLKVAHHGSKTSTSQEWLDYWQPQNAVISVGAKNTYGHPNAGVVQRLNSASAAVFRTDQMGEVQMKVVKGEIEYRYKLGE